MNLQDADAAKACLSIQQLPMEDDHITFGGTDGQTHADPALLRQNCRISSIREEETQYVRTVSKGL